jgi:hypothetical protein
MGAPPTSRCVIMSCTYEKACFVVRITTDEFDIQKCVPSRLFCLFHHLLLDLLHIWWPCRDYAICGQLAIITVLADSKSDIARLDAIATFFLLGERVACV